MNLDSRLPGRTKTASSDEDVRTVVTVFIRRKKMILLLKRSDKVGMHKGMWCGVSGYVEAGEEPRDAATREVSEETGLRVTKLRCGGSLDVRDGRVLWRVHPFLAEVEDGEPRLDIEHTEYLWINPGDILKYPRPPMLEDSLARALGV